VVASTDLKKLVGATAFFNSPLKSYPIMDAFQVFQLFVPFLWAFLACILGGFATGIVGVLGVDQRLQGQL
jgi:hypothetical protein